MFKFRVFFCLVIYLCLVFATSHRNVQVWNLGWGNRSFNYFCSTKWIPLDTNIIIINFLHNYQKNIIIIKWKPWAGTWWPDLRRALHCRPAGWSACSGSSRTCTPGVWMVGEILWTWMEALSHFYIYINKKNSVNLWHVRSIAAHGVVAVVGRELEAAVESNVRNILEKGRVVRFFPDFEISTCCIHRSLPLCWARHMRDKWQDLVARIGSQSPKMLVVG